MGETKERTWVAIGLSPLLITLFACFANAQSTDFKFPSSLSRAGQGAVGTTGNGMGMPGNARVGTRPDGPTSDPAGSFSAWNRGANQGPSTAPYGNSDSNPPSIPGFNAAAQNPNANAPTAATLATDPQTTTGAQRQGGRGWGLPKGITNPTQDPTLADRFGSQFDRAASNLSTMFGPKTQEQARRDEFARGGMGATISRTAQDQLGDGRTGPGSMPSTANGLRWDNIAGTLSNVPTENWTRDQVNLLAAEFGIPPNDPNLDNQLYVNELFFEYKRLREQQRLKAEQEAAAQQNSPWPQEQPSPRGVAASTGGFGMPRTTNAADGDPTSWPFDNSARDPRATQAMLDPSRQSVGLQDQRAGGQLGDPRLYQQTDPRTRQPLGTPYDNDRFASSVYPQDAAYPRDAVNSRTMDMANERFASEYDRMKRMDAEVDDLRRENLRLKEDVLTERILRNNAVMTGVTGNGNFGRGQLAGQAYPGGVQSQAQTQRELIAQSNREPVSASSRSRAGEVPESKENVPIDRAGVAGAAREFKQMNPYVNVFLLCSIVANVFLLVWLHRLWQHHRDLIATSRVTASGISASD
ncbi:MAG: hypothetical protein AAF802_10885 [Planctomycetota bacterium]